MKKVSMLKLVAKLFLGNSSFKAVWVQVPLLTKVYKNIKI